MHKAELPSWHMKQRIDTKIISEENEIIRQILFTRSGLDLESIQVKFLLKYKCLIKLVSILQHSKYSTTAQNCLMKKLGNMTIKTKRN